MKRCLMIATVISLVTTTLMADNIAWDGTSGTWSDATKWGGALPDAGDTVTLPGGNYTLLLDGATPALASFSQNGGTLLFTNWNTALSAATVTINGGVVTHAVTDTFLAPESTNRVYIIADDLTLAAAAKINADAKGFRGGNAWGGVTTNSGQGPGGGIYGVNSGNNHGTAGGGHGGKGGEPYEGSGRGGAVYGAAAMPLLPGSGGAGNSSRIGGNGGGAIRLEVANRLTVDGVISANGAIGNGGGAGGSVYITCDTIAGNGGAIRANGGTLRKNDGWQSGSGGGGGRVAVICNTAAQQGLPQPDIRYSALRGCCDPANKPEVLARNGANGTVFFSDVQLLPTRFAYPDGGRYIGFDSCDLSQLEVLSDNRTYNGGNLSPNSLDNTYVDLSACTNLTASGAVFISGRARLDISNTVFTAAALTIMTNSSLCVYSGEEYLADGDHGALVAVSGALTLADGGIVYPASHPTNGVAPLFRADSVTISSGSGFNADGLGFWGGPGWGFSVTNGYGPGGGIYSISGGNNYGTAGGGHGGKGGDPYSGDGKAGAVYGNPQAPLLPGSGGAGRLAKKGGDGGGVVRLEIANNLAIDGAITANGTKGVGAGAGGSVYIICKTVSGNGGAIRANGGSLGRSEGDTVGGGGGGGRVAIVYDTAAQSLLAKPDVRVSALRGCADPYYGPDNLERNGGLGTVYFSDNQLMAQKFVYPDGGQYHGFKTWQVPELSILSSNRIYDSKTAGSPNSRDNTWVELPDLTNLIVAGSVTISGSARLDVSNCMVTATDFVIHTNAALYVWPGIDAWLGDNCGATVCATGKLSIADNSWIYPSSYPTNGVSALFRVGDLLVATNSGINADGLGWASRSSPQNTWYVGPWGWGPGSGGYRTGGSHAGLGGSTYKGPIYGSSNAPVLCGSAGGGNSEAGHRGGGLVRIEATGAVTLDGAIYARGLNRNETNNLPNAYNGGGSGGAIFIRCAAFSGGVDGVISADGGNSGRNITSGGGGGRVAVWFKPVAAEEAALILAGEEEQLGYRLETYGQHPAFLGRATAAGGYGGTAGVKSGGDGTVVFLRVAPHRGTLMIVR